MISGNTKGKAKLRNLLTNITPTMDTFDTNPSLASSMTDGNPITYPATPGAKALGAAGTIGQITYDLGSTKYVAAGARARVWGDTSVQIDCRIDDSIDNTNWNSANTSAMSATNGLEPTVPRGGALELRACRYLRFRFAQITNTNTTSHVIPHDLVAYELGK